MYYPRSRYTAKLLEHWQRPGHQPILFIGGARRVGKTTMVKTESDNLDSRRFISRYIALDKEDAPPPPAAPLSVAAPSMPYLDRTLPAEDPAPPPGDKSDIAAAWQEARRLADKHRKKTVILILDEIQKIPGWSGALKGLWDEDKLAGRDNLKITALGSAPLLIQKGQETLVGRFELMTLPHWSFGEIQSSYDITLDEYLYFGGYPVVYAERLLQDEERWYNTIKNSIITPYLTKDVAAMTPELRKPALLRTLFEMVCAHPAYIISYNKLQGQLSSAGNTTTIAHYLDCLRDVGLAAGLEKFAKQPVNKRSAPKLIALNSAFAAVYSGYAKFSDALNDRTYRGRLVDNAVGAHLLQTLPARAQLTYWRSGNVEVDYVISWNRKTIAVEVKSGAVRRERHQGLAAFKQEHKNAICKIAGDDTLPIERFLSRPAEEWLEEWENE